MRSYDVYCSGGFGLIGSPNHSALLLLDDISRSAIPVNHSAANFGEQTLFLKHILSVHKFKDLSDCQIWKRALICPHLPLV